MPLIMPDLYPPAHCAHWMFAAVCATHSMAAMAKVAFHCPDMLLFFSDNDEERIQNVLQPSARMRGFFNACYWSSGPSDDVDSTETLDFKLAHPLCVVHEIQLQPFKAYFQLPVSFPVVHVGCSKTTL